MRLHTDAHTFPGSIITAFGNYPVVIIHEFGLCNSGKQ
jgi:hypothetical protein